MIILTGLMSINWQHTQLFQVLFYAATNRGMWVTFNGGETWQTSYGIGTII